ncbi:hypothetical protein BG261_10295 [Floricoccus tropicus]|uniref:HTH LytTR-type domain-containing protein n=1 Tax=Floricoccus tropicus TaxID=1859473 RepID=A0A1E8GP60_9LACT|nr:LytTR family DNA-binding domain-containing protein [Floricoccus tropicus]OFI50025.1 hypothetical protein BG261_10295 [Floricoccus tropicus]
MKINYLWKKELGLDEIDIISNPYNKEKLEKIEKYLNFDLKLSAIDIRNNRSVILELEEIESFESMGHMCKINCIDGRLFHYPNRLKDLSYLEKYKFSMINQSTVFNLSQVKFFSVEKNARLQITSKGDNDYLVSRHYAKKVKEILS